jgi:RNA-directed DNA polymerase
MPREKSKRPNPRGSEFHTDSYGYRPGRSAIDAARTARQRCWRYDWVLDIDVKGYFDSIDWELLLKAVRRQHTDCSWALLYIERWLKAPVQMEDGSVVPRTSGTPQGGVISPLLANLFLHYAFDKWMARTFPQIPFERYADDAICHCKSAEEAQALWGALADRFAACKLVLHPGKTKLVYCKDWNRRGDFPNQSFDFLGYQFRPRKAVWHGHLYVHSFRPAASPKALTAIRRTIRSWQVHHRSDRSLDDLAKTYNPVHPGLGQLLRPFLSGAIVSDPVQDRCLRHTLARRKYKRLRRQTKGAREWLARVRCASPNLSCTGAYGMAAAEHREPYESRDSRTDLGARGGETPPRTRHERNSSLSRSPFLPTSDQRHPERKRLLIRCSFCPHQLPCNHGRLCLLARERL